MFDFTTHGSTKKDIAVTNAHLDGDVHYIVVFACWGENIDFGVMTRDASGAVVDGWNAKAGATPRRVRVEVK